MPETEDDKAAPIVPDDKENTAKERSALPCAGCGTRRINLTGCIPPKIRPGNLNKVNKVDEFVQYAGVCTAHSRRDRFPQGKCYAKRYWNMRQASEGQKQG